MSNPRRTAEQEAALERLEALGQDYRGAKAALHVEVERRVRQELHRKAAQKAQAAKAAYGLGLSKSEIGRALGTKNWATVQDLLTTTATPITEGSL